jgi:probable F420-dependent oxidoreductase
MKFWQAVAFLETDQLLDVASAADGLGYHGIAVSDHIFYPRELTSSYPYTADGVPFWSPDTPWPDPWALISAMAAVTRDLRFTTNIYVAPARDLFTVAKLVSTAAVISRGRVALGAAPGWCADEFAQTGQDFATRGRRLDEMVAALRALWSGGMVEHHGTFYDFDPVQIAPVPPAPVPVYIGGDSGPALRRAARVGDGWIGNAYDEAGAEQVLGRLHAELRAAGRDPDGFEVVIALLAPPSAELYKRFEDKGVTGLVCAPWMVAGDAMGQGGSPLPAKLAAMETFADEVIRKM